MNYSTQNGPPKGPFQSSILLRDATTDAAQNELAHKIIESIYSLRMHPDEKAVLIALFLSQLEGNESPTAAQLAWMTNMSKGTVSHWLRSMKRDAILISVADSGRDVSYAIDLNKVLQLRGGP